MKKKVILIYNYGYPDENVSAIHFHQLGLELQKNNFEVEFWSSNLSKNNRGLKYKKNEVIKDIVYHRFEIPRITFSMNLQKIVNSIYFFLKIVFRLVKAKNKYKNYNFIIGTDPLFIYLISSIITRYNNDTKLFLWNFDLYPECINAHFKKNFILSAFNSISQSIISNSYAHYSAVFSLGTCMDQQINKYIEKNKIKRIVPWSQLEVPNILKKKYLKIDKEFQNKLIINISGNFGNAHDIISTLKTIKRLKELSFLKFYISTTGSQSKKLISNLREEKLDFILGSYVNKDQLKNHLAIADINYVSLDEQWTGFVLPSKFFTSLAVGRPVIFVGSTNSYIYKIIKKLNVGWVINKNLEYELKKYFGDTSYQNLMQKNCHGCYKKYFSKDLQINRIMKSILI